MFVNVRVIFGQVLENLRKSSEIFGKWSEIFGKSSKTPSSVCLYNKKNITRRYEFYVLVARTISHSNIKFISSRHHAISSIYPTSHLYFLGIHTGLEASVSTKKIKWLVGYHQLKSCTTRNPSSIWDTQYRIRCIAFCTMANTNSEKVGCNNVQNTTAFLYSDWLYFL